MSNAKPVKCYRLDQKIIDLVDILSDNMAISKADVVSLAISSFSKDIIEDEINNNDAFNFLAEELARQFNVISAPVLEAIKNINKELNVVVNRITELENKYTFTLQKSNVEDEINEPN